MLRSSITGALAALLMSVSLPAAAQEEETVLEETEGSAGETPEAHQDADPVEGSDGETAEETVSVVEREVTPSDIRRAMDEGAWDTAYELAQSADPVAVPLITWTRLRDGVGTFTEFSAFLEDYPHWPSRDRIRRAGEGSILDDSDPGLVRAFFADGAPQTMAGLRAYVRALEALGDGKQAEEALVRGWLEVRGDNAGQAQMIEEFGRTLAPLHAERAHAALWRWRTDDAERMLPLLSDDQQALVAARIALIRGRGDAGEKVAAVPAALAGHPGLAYDRFNRMADNFEYTLASPILEARDTAEKMGEPFRWASWRATLARWHMREGRPQLAYDLASRHFLTEGQFYADLEWLAGFVALSDLDAPETALGHFERMADSVDSPISLSRGYYWVGRAQEALGDMEAAADAFAKAAQHQTAFYGLLAAERLGLSLDPALTGEDDPTDWQGAAIMDEDIARAVQLLLEAGDRSAALTFTVRLARDYPADDVSRFGAWLTERNEMFLALIAGKAAIGEGKLIPSLYFPIHDLAGLELPVEPALSLSIARRESEFNAGAGSPVGALGLMQLMPATAQEVAGWLGLPYSKARLTQDWEYNARLGSRYLRELEDLFGTSPVLISSGYNAGPSRPRTWMSERGDPRRAADVVDWIEHIPFTETRNYAMRVTESIPAYRARLTGQGGTIRFTDLLKGNPPLVRPRARGRVGSVLEVDTAPPAEFLPGPPGRPEPRPEDVVATSGAAPVLGADPAPASPAPMRPAARPVN